MNKFHIIIPARYASTRLPGKLLLDIHGKPLIQRVYELAMRCDAATVTIATDDQRIYAAAKEFGAAVYMTDPAHSCGTERLAEMVGLLNLSSDDIVINLQGDEPLIPVDMVTKVAEELAVSPLAQVATLATPIISLSEVFDPNVVKVVLTAENYALLFSRSPIPWQRDAFSKMDFITAAENTQLTNKPLVTACLRHVGLYAYRCSALQQFVTWPVSPIETVEYLEQLRFMWHGQKIKVAVVADNLPKGVDVHADLEAVRALYDKKSVV